MCFDAYRVGGRIPLKIWRTVTTMTVCHIVSRHGKWLVTASFYTNERRLLSVTLLSLGTLGAWTSLRQTVIPPPVQPGNNHRSVNHILYFMTDHLVYHANKRTTNNLHLHIWEYHHSRLPLLWRVSLPLSEAKVSQPYPPMIDFPGLPETTAKTI